MRGEIRAMGVILPLYGAAHIVVDACCAAVAFSIPSVHADRPDTFIALLVLYHVLAFGFQPIFGLAVDALHRPRFAAVLGCLVSGCALALVAWPLAAIVVAGLGNALFHVGGGVVSLRLTPGRATAPGLFVAPGSIGLLMGAILGKIGPYAAAPLVPVGIVLCLLIALADVPAAERLPRRGGAMSRGELVLAFILLSIVVRSLLGFLVRFPWETQPVSLLALTAATVLGKAVGGGLADRCGWLPVGVGGMAAALPFLACASLWPAAAIPGLFLLNLTMPVTLAATAEVLPGHPGFAFGLTCLALLLGALPPLLGVAASGPLVVTVIIVLSAAALWRGLRLLSFDPQFTTTVRV